MKCFSWTKYTRQPMEEGEYLVKLEDGSLVVAWYFKQWRYPAGFCSPIIEFVNTRELK